MAITESQKRAIAKYRAKHREEISRYEKERRKALRTCSEEYVEKEKNYNRTYRGSTKTRDEFFRLSTIDV